MNDRPVWSISKAANECGVSRDTIKRRRAAGGFPNAYQDGRSQWMIPVTDLLAAGLHPGRPSPPQGGAHGQHENAPERRPGREAELENELRVMEVKLAGERQLRQAAERNAEDLRASLRMLDSATPHQTPANAAPMSPEKAVPSVRAPRKRWFSR